MRYSQNAETGFKQQSAHESASNEATKESEGSADASAQTNHSELIGTWLSPCLSGPGFNLKIAVQFSPTEVVKTNYRYDDDICNSLFLKEIRTDRYAIVEEGKTTMPYKTDSQRQTTTFTPMSDRGVTYLNEVKPYGLSNWSLNSPKYILSKFGQMFYTIVKVEGSKLYLGNTVGVNDGSTPEKRPTTFNDDLILTKQN